MRCLLNTLYVTNPEAYLHKKDDAIEVKLDGKTAMSVPFHLLDGVVLFGHVGCSTAFLATCADKGLSVVLLDEAGRYKARVEGPTSGNILLREAQYRVAASDSWCLSLARRFVVAKIHNSKVVLQHYLRDYPELKSVGVDSTLNELEQARQAAISACTIENLRGTEGLAARSYFSSFGHLLRVTDSEIAFGGRSRRPPRDPVNAALSLFYTLLSRDEATACHSVGLDPQRGYLHASRPGRYSLALDLMEELRSPVVDRFVISLFNRRQLDSGDFKKEGEDVRFTSTSLKKAIGLWQEKKQEKILHPFTGDRVELGLIPFLQAQLLARYLRGDLDDYPAMLWR
ncbi:MAG: type I-C CRISPR-associated endonuclease Cas1c [Tractidigestivibacter sp.]|jgi:CRISPR-associated protein Cas1|uniref:type I-C CRISPR-associated endonuclease Cas1c n=1 Tax=Tractidigestivibacter sp. TaxID=2847320 RepID=UPI003D90CA23